MVGARTKKEIGISVIRAGDIVGDHTVLLSGPGERIELRHQAHSRDAFAAGALTAAAWVSKKKAGLYTMADVLHLK
jgi:4-hydroxy-tetrahydrodipicolinate reductase